MATPQSVEKETPRLNEKSPLLGTGIDTQNEVHPNVVITNQSSNVVVTVPTDPAVTPNNTLQEEVNTNYTRHTGCYAALIYVFYGFCFFTGLCTPCWTLEDGKTWNVGQLLLLFSVYGFGICFLIGGTVLNVYSFVFDMIAIAFCEFDHLSCDFIYTRNSTEKDVTTNLSGTIAHYYNWQKTVITTATVSGTLSYIFIIFVLYGQYSCLFKCYRWYTKQRFFERTGSPNDTEQKTDDKGIVVHPFLDRPYKALDILTENKDNDDFIYIPSITTFKQTSYFMLIFWLNFLVFSTNLGLIVTMLYRNIGYSKPSLEAIDILGLGVQFFSQFCAILSCFIFSKVAYAVSNRCLDFSQCVFKKADILRTDPEWENLRDKFQFREDEDVTHLKVLKKMDQVYVKLVENSLRPYGTWFAIHWVLYTVTAFMSIAYFIDQVEIQLYGSGQCHNPIPRANQTDCELVLAYLFFFAIEHCVLFLYPCFRAASVTKARSQMIKYVSRREWTHVSQTDINSFVTYLKDQNCTFKIAILCARLSFGFNMAYISIFVGTLGIILKVSL